MSPKSRRAFLRKKCYVLECRLQLEAVAVSPTRVRSCVGAVHDPIIVSIAVWLGEDSAEEM